MAALESLFYCDYSLSIKAGVHFTLCGGTICKLGTKKHHDAYLDRMDTLDLPGSFSMTELGEWIEESGEGRRGEGGGDEALCLTGQSLAGWVVILLLLLLLSACYCAPLHHPLTHPAFSPHTRLLPHPAPSSRPGHGSNVMGIETVATYDPIAREFIIHTPNNEASKYWIGGTGQHGKVRALSLSGAGGVTSCKPLRK